MYEGFALQDFIRHLDSPLLGQYCLTRKISFAPKKNEGADEAAERFHAALGKLSKREQKVIEAELRSIDELATPLGRDELLGEASRKRITIPLKDIGGMHLHNTALWFFLEKGEIFEAAHIWVDVDTFQTWKSYRIDPPKNSDPLQDRHTDLEYALREFFIKKDKTGARCVIECYPKEDRVCYVAYPEGPPEITVGYTNIGKLNKRNVSSPVSKIHFVYEPGLKRLRVKTGKRGNSTKLANDLAKEFKSSVLQDKSEADADSRVFNLDVLKDFDFAFPTPQADDVGFIQVKSLTFVYNEFPHRRIVIDVGDGRAEKLEGMRILAEAHRISLEDSRITQATIHVQFRNKGRGRKGSVTAHLTMPNSWDLTDKDLHTKVKDYLRDWHIDYGTQLPNLS